MLVIGIDPGTARTGYGLIQQSDSGSLYLVDFGVIETSPKLPMSERLLKLHHDLQDLLAQHKPVEAAVERLFFQKNVKTAITVGQARGVAILALAELDLNIKEYSPQEVKQAVTGYGAAEKGQVQRMVQNLLEMDELPRPDDAADALAVAICHCYVSKLERRIEGAE
ncbi:MAG: crossover junction endodeoxyribonuclease RuvC [Anaerolineales bacterium]|nr:crossover junction endodeoxyribonuclease RuvC [Anaerolineales bacterium]MCK5633606.1 crossover junction endodeoxyribonuclease RuvC [Anaerolineales bacterium]